MSRWRIVFVLWLGILAFCLSAGAWAQAAGPGQLSIVTPEGNIALVGADSQITPLTTDAGATAASVRFYQWPTWSPSGSLAYFGAEVTRQGERTLEMWIRSQAGAPAVVYQAAGETYTYAYWSPGSCASGQPCGQVAALISGASPDGFALKQIPADGSDAQTVGQGAPFYFDWSPDGQQMAWHRGNTRLDIYSLAQGAVVGTLPEQTGLFTAPAFSPADDGALLFGAWDADNQTTRLVVQRGDEQTTLAPDLPSGVSFAWSPDGTEVAWRESHGPLVVVNAATGEEVARTPSTGIVAFFWSPMGDRLAYVTFDAAPAGSFSAKRPAMPARQAETPRLLWSVLTVSDGTIQRGASFVPTQEMAYLLGYFDQFSLSHRVWSPDGTRIAYGELLAPDQPVVQVFDWSVPQAVPQAIAPGVIGIWSFE